MQSLPDTAARAREGARPDTSTHTIRKGCTTADKGHVHI